MKYQAEIPIKSRLEGVDRRNLKIINFEQILPEVRVRMSNNEIRVRKRVLLAMSCSINADNLGN